MERGVDGARLCREDGKRTNIHTKCKDRAGQCETEHNACLGDSGWGFKSRSQRYKEGGGDGRRGDDASGWSSEAFVLTAGALTER